MSRRIFLAVCIGVGAMGVAVGGATLWGAVQALLP